MDIWFIQSEAKGKTSTIRREGKEFQKKIVGTGMISEAMGRIMMYNPQERLGFTILRKGKDIQSEGKWKGFVQRKFNEMESFLLQSKAILFFRFKLVLRWF